MPRKYLVILAGIKTEIAIANIITDTMTEIMTETEIAIERGTEVEIGIGIEDAIVTGTTNVLETTNIDMVTAKTSTRTEIARGTGETIEREKERMMPNQKRKQEVLHHQLHQEQVRNAKCKFLCEVWKRRVPRNIRTGWDKPPPEYAGMSVPEVALVNPSIVLARLPVAVGVPANLIPQETVPCPVAAITPQMRQARRLYVGNLPAGTTDVSA